MPSIDTRDAAFFTVRELWLRRALTWQAQDDNSALEAEVARLKAGMSQALTEAKSQLQVRKRS